MFDVVPANFSINTAVINVKQREKLEVVLKVVSHADINCQIKIICNAYDILQHAIMVRNMAIIEDTSSGHRIEAYEKRVEKKIHIC